ncbi:MAG: DUF1566 domain-containing protein [Proteobacteria bacterium]|nr:DUF1566 domain-containing protein [Pseudomonadota bacterium]
MKKILCLTVTLMVLMTGLAHAGTVNLPRTGQTKCYDTSGNKITCAGTGQDGDIQAGVAWPEPRFTDNGDGRMTDNLTGLMWTKDANLPGGTKIWQETLDYCNNLTLGGYSDWRLPNINELESLVNGAESNTTTWLNTQGFTNVQADGYWSSTSCAGLPDLAWVVHMWYGLVVTNVCYSGVCYGSKSDDYYVWPVRSGQVGSLENSVISLPQTGQTKCFGTYGNEIPCSGTGQDGEIQAGVGWPNPRFTDHGDTVTDNLTGLMWTKNAGLPGVQETWQQALNYVKGMNSGTYQSYGYTDWRLPNRKELHSLTDYSQHGPALPSYHPFPNANRDWSSTTFAYDPGYAWIVDMWDGIVCDSTKSVSFYYVWPVRGGQSGPLDHWVISGAIMHRGSGLQNVTMTLSGDASMTTSTRADGTYSFTDLSNGTYVITPSKSGYKFWPKSRSITINDSDVSEQNFRGIKMR